MAKSTYSYAGQVLSQPRSEAWRDIFALGKDLTGTNGAVNAFFSSRDMLFWVLLILAARHSMPELEPQNPT